MHALNMLYVNVIGDKMKMFDVENNTVRANLDHITTLFHFHYFEIYIASIDG